MLPTNLKTVDDLATSKLRLFGYDANIIRQCIAKCVISGCILAQFLQGFYILMLLSIFPLNQSFNFSSCLIILSLGLDRNLSYL